LRHSSDFAQMLKYNLFWTAPNCHLFFKQNKNIAAFVGLWNFWLCPRIWLSYGPPSVCNECSTVVHHVAARARAFPRAFVCQETVDAFSYVHYPVSDLYSFLYIILERNF
jgi:hypothetical protein